MRSFAYHQPIDIASGLHNAASEKSAQYLAGGTTLLDLMKLDVMRPAEIVDLKALRSSHDKIMVDAAGLRLGAFARMADVADNQEILHHYPVIAQSLMLAASAQLRNMATLGGNVLQRTRCEYFRDVRTQNCNKRNPGSGCAAIGGVTRQHAVLGTSNACIATYPGDFAAALIALDASVDIVGGAGPRSIKFADLHRSPGATPHVETSLAPGDLIIGFRVKAAPWTRRSVYLKVRDRDSYQFALASAAVALDLSEGVLTQARIGLGGVAATPWRAHQAEAFLTGKPLTVDAAKQAGRLAFDGAKSDGRNAFKLKLGPLTVTRALVAAGRMEV
jgi:xanthine dehydrogenase YagS FAD-binding subunit